MEIRYKKAVIRQSVDGIETETEVMLPDFGDEDNQKPIGVWGQRRLKYIRNHKKVLYAELLTSGKLNEHFADINEEAEEMLFRLVKELAAKENVTEELKAQNQMAWVGKMNNIRNRAMEIVNSELIYN